MDRRQEIGHEFEKLVSDILGLEYSVESLSEKQSSDNFSVIAPDLIAYTAQRKERFAVEVKYFSSALVPYRRLEAAARSAINAADSYRNFVRAFEKQQERWTAVLLIVSAYVPASDVKAIRQRFPDLIIRDRRTLIESSIADDELYRRLRNFFPTHETESKEDTFRPSETPSLRADSLASDLRGRQTDFDAEPSEPLMGKNLCQDLRKIPKGGTKRDATRFEEHVRRIFEYLFNSLKMWRSQHRTLNPDVYIDSICRIDGASGNSLWELVRDLGSTFLVIECKNYDKSEITQNDIFVSEKYLYSQARRTVCFLVSRKAWSDSAIQAAKAAMRDRGKLFINLVDDDLCDMLALADRGEDVEGFLIERISDALLDLSPYVQ